MIVLKQFPPVKVWEEKRYFDNASRSLEKQIGKSAKSVLIGILFVEPEEKNTDCSNIVGSSFPDEYYEIFQLLPMDMSCIEYVDTLLENQGGTIDSLNIYNLTL